MGASGKVRIRKLLMKIVAEKTHRSTISRANPNINFVELGSGEIVERLIKVVLDPSLGPVVVDATGKSVDPEV